MQENPVESDASARATTSSVFIVDYDYNRAPHVIATAK
tara:strand:- start:40 stop:153 length:114 start_codon:yes stop_codon:yes gene_type:complete